jgi:hypothetical protein
MGNLDVISNKFNIYIYILYVLKICNMKFCTEWYTEMHNYYSIFLIILTV